MKVYDGSTAEQASESPSRAERVKVGIAEYEVTTDEAALTTSGLGSCIGVALYDPVAGTAGLVHVMLPDTDDSTDGNPAKFADAGVELLLEELEAAGADPDRVEAKIAGGSDMLDFSDDGVTIGEQNARRVRETLDRHGVPLVDEDVGGDHGRSLRFEAATGDLVVKSANQSEHTL